jgi:hypothetical protein
VGDDQLRAGIALDEPAQVVGDRRQPAAAVDQDRDVRSAASAKTGASRSSFSRKRCAAGGA